MANDHEQRPETDGRIVSGHGAICAAYRDEAKADDYIRSRYESDPFGRATHEHQVRRLQRILTVLAPKRMLEVAPGPGRLTVHLPRVEQGIGVEQSPAMIRVAEQRLREFGREDWRIQQGDAFDLPFRSREFDVAMSFKLLRHFDRSNRLRLMDNLRNSVRPGGHIILDVANVTAYRWLHRKWGIEKGWIDDYWFTAEDFRAEMRDADVSSVKFYPIQPAIAAQYYCWSRLARLSGAVARCVGRGLEWWPWGEPLEWIAVCRCA
jgi:SAM-dependent methyltransferase